MAPSALKLEQLDAELIGAFLKDLEERRRNSPDTRHTRLAAIRSFFRFLEHREPAALEQIRRVLAIPFKKPTRAWFRISPRTKFKPCSMRLIRQHVPGSETEPCCTWPCVTACEYRN